MGKQRWTRRWKHWVAKTRLPGVWRIKEGGFLVRTRVKNPYTGRMREIRRILPEVDPHAALQWLEQERERVQSEFLTGARQRQRFCDYAICVLEAKVAKGDLTTEDSQLRWKHTLEHLIGGTFHEDGKLAVLGFGELFVDEIRASHIEAWKTGIGKLIRAGRYSPNTVNSWLSVLRVVMKEGKRDFDLPGLATEGVKNFDTRSHVTYTEEEPNSLTPADVPRFLSVLRTEFPQHYAMAYLGFATGLRPSSLRPLRRCGQTPDVLWEEQRLLVRRSQTSGKVVRETTKQGIRYSIELPDGVLEVLRWHVRTQLETDEQRESELLFPALDGSFRARSVLTKPFARASRAIGLSYEFTARGMRRTFNDLARAADVDDLVTRSISGHLTERMQHHYSTVRRDEQRLGMSKVVGLFSTQLSSADTTETDFAEQGGAPSGAPPHPGGAPGALSRKEEPA